MKSKTLYINDKTTTKDAKIGYVASKYELHQFINKLIHVLENLFFCTDLVFTSQPNLVMDLSVYLSLHPNYYNQIKQEIWRWEQGNTELIKRLAYEFNW